MPAPTKFHFTSHARRRSGERDITQALFIEVVTNHEKRKQQYRGTRGGFVYLFSKKIDERELHIAAEVRKDDCFFVTGFWT
ncbi:MAG: DUF4258 domain-containing protein [Verrucomicrobiales bacterium]